MNGVDKNETKLLKVEGHTVTFAITVRTVEHLLRESGGDISHVSSVDSEARIQSPDCIASCRLKNVVKNEDLFQYVFPNVFSKN